MSWIRATVSAAGDTADAVGDCLDALGAVSVSIEAGGDEELLEPAPGETPVWSSTRVSGLFEAGQDRDALHGRLEQSLAALGATHLTLSSVEDTDWISAWRQNAQPRCFGSDLWVLPHDAESPVGARAVVRLDPGLAFGTGSHATTALCLQWLGRARVSGRTVLDLGCGSGILAIAAARLGARRVLAVDHDPQALQATETNARLNHVAPIIRISASLPDEPVQVVLANILANTLCSLAPRIEALSAPGADLVLSGILAAQTEQVWACYRQGFEERHVDEREGWAAIIARRRGDTS